MRGIATIAHWTPAELLESYTHALAWKDSSNWLEQDIFQFLENEMLRRNLPLPCPTCGAAQAVRMVGGIVDRRCNHCGQQST